MSLSRLARMAFGGAIATIVVLSGVSPAAGSEQRGHSGDAVRFATFNASLNRGTAGQLRADLSTPDNAQARVIAEIVQRARPGRAADQRVRLRPAGRGAVPRQLSGRGPERRAPVRYPYHFIAPCNTGIASGFDLNNNGTVVTTPGAPGYGDDALGFGAFPGQFGMVVYSQLPDRPARRPHVPELPVEGHAGRAAARRPGHPGARRLVLAGGARGRPAVVEEPLGRADRDRPPHRPLPRRAPDTAGLRRRGGPQRTPQLRRDPASGPTTSRRARAATSTTTAASAAACGPASSFVIAGDQNSDPLDGDSIPGAAQQLLDNRVDRRLVHAVERRCGRGGGAAGRRQRHAPQRPALRHGRLRRHRTGQPARRLRAAVPVGPDRPRRRRVLAGPGRSAVPAHRRLPVPELRPPSGLARRTHRPLSPPARAGTNTAGPGSAVSSGRS